MRARRIAAILSALVLAIGLLFLISVTVRSTGGVLVPSEAVVRLTGGPVVHAVDPNSAPNDLDTAVVISGTGFTPVPTLTLGSTRLEQVGWVSSATLTATIPWGLEPAVYTLTVVNPNGETGFLANAFTVTQGIGVWTSGGPYGGDIRHVVLNPVTPTQVNAAAVWSGLFASHDAAGSWEPALVGGFPERPAFDAGDPKVRYVGLGGSLLRSVDGGLTWDDLPRQRRCSDSVRPITHPALPGTVYLAAFCHMGVEPKGSLHRSTDGGATWITITTGLSDTNVTSLAFHPHNPNIVYLGTQAGEVYSSTNGGDTWVFAARLPNHVDGLHVNPFGAHEVWADSNGYMVADPSPAPNLFRSLNPGLTAWETITITGQPVWSLTFHPTISGTIWAGVENGFVSADGGDTWAPAGPGLPGWFWAGVKEFAIDPSNPATLYGATGAGVYKSTDGGASWNPASHNLAGIVPIALSVSPFDPREVYLNTNIPTVLKTNNGGRSWQRLDIPPPGWAVNLATDPFIPHRVYFSGPCDVPCFRLSEDGGLTYREVTYTLPITWADGGAHTNLVAPDPSSPGHIVMASGLVHPNVPWGDVLLYGSDDYGEHWQHLSAWSLRPVKAIAFDPSSPGVLYVASVGLYKSADGGGTWQALTAGQPELDAVETVTVHPHNPGTVFMGVSSGSGSGFEQGIYRSLDGGETWEFLSGEPSGGPPRALAFALTDPPILYFGGVDTGLWRSMNNGQTWEVAAGMSQGTVLSLATTTDGDRVIVYVGISGGAVTESGLTGPAAGEGTTLLGSGVFRLTTVLPPPPLFLPLVAKGPAP
jgi:photosystem II stability/assembly factor-like uncharacterized protein